MGGSLSYCGLGSGGAQPSLRAKTKKLQMRPGESDEAFVRRLLATLPRGDKIICNDRRGGTRSCDRKIWAKLSAVERGQYIERIRAEQAAL